ncbi:Gti1/Pac2 family-domain-containing protein [Mycena sanguinolenta]|nr:Gti1/Pac2 family-domain-containing protein [Mycena sanguinolenta]
MRPPHPQNRPPRPHPALTRRLHDTEWLNMIASGAVFVFDEGQSGVKRWTDGCFWSLSRILGNFLICKEFSFGFEICGGREFRYLCIWLRDIQSIHILPVGAYYHGRACTSFSLPVFPKIVCGIGGCAILQPTPASGAWARSLPVDCFAGHGPRRAVLPFAAGAFRLPARRCEARMPGSVSPLGLDFKTVMTSDEDHLACKGEAATIPLGDSLNEQQI